MRRALAPLLLLFALVAGTAQAQPVPAQVVPSDTARVAADSAEVGETEPLEALAEDDQAGDPTELIELFDDLRENPLDVNRAGVEELALVPALGPLAAAAIVRYREANGPFGSIPELRLVEGVSAEAYAAARPYLTIGERLSIQTARPSPYPRFLGIGEIARGLTVQTIGRVQRRLDTAAGFRVAEGDSAAAYAGGPERIYTRFLARYRRNFSAGLTLEKDPGEAFAFEGESPGFDYASAHLAILRSGRIDALVVGDFVAEFGQGLALWRASGFGKGPDATRGPLRAGRGLRPYASVDENRFFRGAGATIAVTPNLYASAFASRRRLDASFTTPDSLDLADPDFPTDFPEDGVVVTGLGADGLHRTARERERKDALGETLFGGGLEGRYENRAVAIRGGVVGYQARFDSPLVAADRPDAVFNFEGDEAAMVSAYASARARAGQAFAEVARAPGGAVGAVGGLVADLGGDAELLLVGRTYPRDFTTLHGYPFGERNGVGQNERGLYAGLRVRPTRTWSAAAYFDQYRFPWLRFGVPRPSTGYEALGFVEHRPRRWLRVYAQARTETREASLDVPGEVPGSVVNGLARETRQTLRLQGEYDASRSLRFRARIEGARFAEDERLTDVDEGERSTRLGVLLFQDVRYQALEWLRLDARLTFFDTDGFDARLYQYENDLTGVFAIPVLSGRGTRAYAMLTLTPAERLSIQVKLAGTRYEDVRRVSSGDNEVEGPRVRDLGVQVRYTL